MNILFCNYEYPPLGGGGGVMNAEIARELAKRHQVTVLTSQGMDLPAYQTEEGVEIVRAPVFFRQREAVANFNSMLAYIPMGIMAGMKLLQTRHFDIINTHFALPTGPVGDALARYGRIPNVLTVHGGDLYDPSKRTSPHRHAFLRLWIRSLLRQANAVVGQSHNTLDNMHQYYAPEIEGIRIPLGISRPRCYEAKRSDFDFGPDDILLITVGRLVARKAINQLISMVKSLDHPQVKLVVVGSGPQEEELKAQARHEGVDGQVRFMGYVDDCDKFRLLGLSDIYVSTSQHEGFCLAYLEGMTNGLPVVAYDFGGHTDYLKDGETGFLVPLNNQELFTQRTRQLIADASLRRQMGAYNHRAAEEYYVDNTALRYETLFYKTIEAHKRARQKSATAASRMTAPLGLPNTGEPAPGDSPAQAGGIELPERSTIE